MCACVCACTNKEPVHSTCACIRKNTPCTPLKIYYSYKSEQNRHIYVYGLLLTIGLKAAFLHLIGSSTSWCLRPVTQGARCRSCGPWQFPVMFTACGWFAAACATISWRWAGRSVAMCAQGARVGCCIGSVSGISGIPCCCAPRAHDNSSGTRLDARPCTPQ